MVRGSSVATGTIGDEKATGDNRPLFIKNHYYRGLFQFDHFRTDIESENFYLHKKGNLVRVDPSNEDMKVLGKASTVRHQMIPEGTSWFTVMFMFFCTNDAFTKMYSRYWQVFIENEKVTVFGKLVYDAETDQCIFDRPLALISDANQSV